MERAYLELYFERTNPAKCVFLDRSLVMTDWADGRIDIALLKALCACGYRLNPRPDDYQISTGLTPGDHRDDSVALQWIREAQESVLQRIGTPSLQILQALVLIIRFNIDAADSIVAWNLMPLAARLMFTMRLNYESPESHPVIQEIRRRLVWAIYLIDCILCGGVQDLVVCPVERLEIRLPCEDHTFEKGAPSRAQFLGEPLSGRTEDMSPAAYLVMLYSVRFRILRLVADYCSLRTTFDNDAYVLGSRSKSGGMAATPQNTLTRLMHCSRSLIVSTTLSRHIYSTARRPCDARHFPKMPQNGSFSSRCGFRAILICINSSSRGSRSR
jgi:hypothetical protein